MVFVKDTIFQVLEAVNVKIALLVSDAIMCGFGRLYCRQNSLTLIK
jgi:adenosylmethionine-8-amino-7-oxononanoate aminotransferase